MMIAAAAALYIADDAVVVDMTYMFEYARGLEIMLVFRRWAPRQ